MNIEKLTKPLSVDQIDFRVQSINKGGYATILAYKDARADMARLDEAVGPLNWQRTHINGNHNCIVSIWCDKKKAWVTKEDTGTESFTEAQKGLASDSFKRACFNWGIGRELYDYPVIQVELNGSKDREPNGSDEWCMVNGKPKQHWGLKLKQWEWFSEFDDHGVLTMLAAKDQNGKMRYEWRNIKLVEGLAAELLSFIANESWSELVEAWNELEEWESRLLWTAKTKGGFFDTEQKALIKVKLNEQNEEEAAA